MARVRRRSRGRARRDPLARERALEALNRMRASGLSLTKAARDARTTPRTILKYVGSAVARTASGRYAPTKSDRLTRRVWLLTRDGKVEIATRGSRSASRVARHSAAVDQYLRHGSTEALQEFENQTIRAGKVAHPFVTDTAVLERLALAGEVSFESLYSLRA